MSNPDIKIKSLSLQNFRGAKGLLNLDFGDSCKSSAIFGYNGEGKSTIKQALEWFLFNRIAVLSGEGVSDDDIVNLSSTAVDDTSVDIVFNKLSLNSSKIFDKKKQRHNHSNTSTEFANYIKNTKHERLYLDQNTMMWFLAQPKGDKKAEIAKIVGYEEIVKVKSTISGTLNELQRNSRLRDIQTRFAYNQGLMTKDIYGEAVNDLAGLFSKSQEILKTFGIYDKLDSIDKLDVVTNKAIQLLPSQERAKERLHCEILKEKILSLMSKSDIFEKISILISIFNEIVQDQIKISKLNLSKFLQQAEKVLKDSIETEVCPLCEQSIKNPDELLKCVIKRYLELKEISEKIDNCKKGQIALNNDLSEIKKEWENILAELELINLKNDITYIHDYINAVKEIYDDLETHFRKNTSLSFDLEKNKLIYEKLNNTITDIIHRLGEKINNLSISEEEKNKQNAFTKLTRGKTLVIENIQYNKEIEAFKLQIKDLEKIEEQLLEIQNTTISNILDLLSKDINNYFCYLNRKDYIKGVKLAITGEEGIEFALEFYGFKASPPKKYLSESQLNSLGIAFFLAAVKQFNKSNKYFVLDDVLLSFDKNYRLRLLDLLEKEFTDFQVLLLTHEEYWYQLARRKFPEWVFKEVTWSFDQGIVFESTKANKLSNLRQKCAKGENIGNDLRTYVESLLKDICYSLEVRVPYRHSGSENDKRMIGELFPALTSTLKDHKSSVINITEYKDLQVSNFILTTASHDNPDYSSMGDIGETINKIEKFEKLFICSKGRLIEKKIPIPGQNKISCKCGCININWKE